MKGRSSSKGPNSSTRLRIVCREYHVVFVSPFGAKKKSWDLWTHLSFRNVIVERNECPWPRKRIILVRPMSRLIVNKVQSDFIVRHENEATHIKTKNKRASQTSFLPTVLKSRDEKGTY